jgi:hypothetical protein
MLVSVLGSAAWGGYQTVTLVTGNRLGCLTQLLAGLRHQMLFVFLTQMWIAWSAFLAVFVAASFSTYSL